MMHSRDSKQSLLVALASSLLWFGGVAFAETEHHPNGAKDEAAHGAEHHAEADADSHHKGADPHSETEHHEAPAHASDAAHDETEHHDAAHQGTEAKGHVEHAEHGQPNEHGAHADDGAHGDGHHGAESHLELAHFAAPAASGKTMIPPAVLLVLGALVLAFIPGKLRAVAAILFPAVVLGYIAFSLNPGDVFLWGEHTLKVGPYELAPLRVDKLSTIFGLIFSLVGVVAGVYAFHENDRKQQVSAMLYNAGALGVTFAGDYFTLYGFWELMAVASTILIWARNNKESQAAGMRYLITHLVGGSILLAGVLMHSAQTGSIAFEHFDYDMGNVAAWLVLIGFALNAAIPPFGPWLPDAYPRATITGAIFCSALTTKTAVYTLIRGFAGWDILMVAGVVMALYGVVYAVLANDVRELLGYHIISQVGYMVAAVGLGVQLAINGAVAHAICHILYKSVLFMGAGIVIDTTGKEKMSDLGGFWHRQKFVLALYMIGAFSISGFPFFNGFISKSMVTAAAHEMYMSQAGGHHEGEEHHASIQSTQTLAASSMHAVGAVAASASASPARLIDNNPHLLNEAHTEHPASSTGLRESWAGWMFMLLMLASVGTFLHTGLKLPLGVWFGEDKGIQPKPAKINMMVAMGMSGGLCFFFGVAPGLLYQWLPFEMVWEPYTASHFWEMTQVLVFTFFAFYIFIPQLQAKPYISMDTDVLFRKTAPQFKMLFVDVTVGIYSWCLEWATAQARGLTQWLRDPNIDIAINQSRLPSDENGFDPDRARYPVGFALTLTLIVLISLTLLAFQGEGTGSLLSVLSR